MLCVFDFRYICIEWCFPWYVYAIVLLKIKLSSSVRPEFLLHTLLHWTLKCLGMDIPNAHVPGQVAAKDHTQLGCCHRLTGSVINVDCARFQLAASKAHQ